MKTKTQKMLDVERAQLLKESERYYAPAPPKKGKIIGVDCHPDIFTASVVKGTTPYDMVHLETKGDITFNELTKWASENFTSQDIFLVEAGSNSFEVHRRFSALGLQVCVLESGFVGHHAKKYSDNDRIASLRIADVYLGRKTPAVWVPDRITLERRELLHLYNKSVTTNTQTTNGLKGYLNQYGIRLGKKNIYAKKTHQWIGNERQWTPLQAELLESHFSQIEQSHSRRKKLSNLIINEVVNNPKMLSLMSLLGIGKINAFGLIAIIGDISRFSNPKKLACYLGLNPGQRESGTGKRIKVGVGKRGRKDMRTLLIQSAQCVMRMGSATTIGQWGWKLFARKGNRNVAVAAVARKLSAQVWHLLMGNQPNALENSRSRDTKFRKMLGEFGKEQRLKIGLTGKIAEEIATLNAKIKEHNELATWGCHPKPRQAAPA